MVDKATTDPKVTYAKAMTSFKDKFLPVNKGKSFTIEDVLRFFGCMNDNKDARQAYYMVLYNLSEVNKNSILERSNKIYRYINKELNLIEWHNVKEKGKLNIMWPYGIQDKTSFGFEQDIVLYEGDIIMVAGEGNRGKTAFALNFMVENMNNYPVNYFTTEFNAMKFRDRMSEFKWASLFKDDGTPKFNVIDRHDNWQDVIQPDTINIIDWIKLDDEMWKIRAITESIQKNLGKGIAFLCQQKRSYKKDGEGGEYGKDLASVYLSLSYDEKMKTNLLYVEKVKTPGLIDPNFSKFSFNIYRGAEFAKIKRVVKHDE